MKNKKIIVSLLIVVLILSTVAACLVGCNKDWKEIDIETASQKLSYALNNMENYPNLNNIEAATKIDVKTTYGNAKNSYTVEAAAKLGLNKDDDNKNALSIVIKDNTDANAVKTLLGVYYDEATSPNVYLIAGDTKLALKGVNVKEIIKEKGAVINDEWCEGAKSTVTDFIDSALCGEESYLGMICDMGGKLYTSKDGNTIRLSLSLGDVLSKAGELLGALDPVFEDLGLDLKSTTLGDVLPKLTISIDLKFKGSGESTELAGIGANVSCDKKTITVNKTNNNGKLAEIEIANNFTAEVSGDVYISPETSMIQKMPGKETDYTAVNALNVKATGKVIIEEDIKAPINISESFKLDLNIPKGEYDITLAIDADPTKLLDITLDKGASVHDTINTVASAVTSCLDYLLIDIKAPGSETSLIKAEVTDTDNTDVLTITALEIDALGLSDYTGLLLDSDISTLFNLIKEMIPDTEYPTDDKGDETLPSGVPSGTTSGTESGLPSGGDDEESASITAADVIKNLTIIMKAGQISASLANMNITEDISLGAGITVNSEGVTIDATVAGLNKIGILSELPAEINATIKLTSISLGTARK